MEVAPRAIAYDLRLGVSGHRNLSDWEGVAHAAEQLLDHLQRTFESATEFPRGPAGSRQGFSRRMAAFLTRSARWAWPSLPTAASHVSPEQRTPLHWAVVSPLAAGADRIVARAVLKRPAARVYAVSPFAVDDYRRDFREPGDRAEFDELWKLDPNPVELNRDYACAAAGDTEEQAHVKQAQRNEGYLQAGQWVVDHCEILIVVWDGLPAAARGGTGDVVRYAVEQGRTVLWIDANRPEQPVRWIVGLETDSAQPEGAGADGLRCRPLPTRAKELSTSFHQLAGYNRDAAFDLEQYGKARRQAGKQLQEVARNARLREEVLAPAMERLLPECARADQLAVRYQTLHVAATQWLHGLAALAVTMAVVQILFFPMVTWLILFEVAALLLVLALLEISRNEAWHGKWLRDRLLAEQMRTAAFTTAVGSGRTRDHTQTQRLLPFYHAPDSWVFGALQAILRDVRPVRLVSADLGPLKQFVVDGWISDQARWHEINSGRKQRAADVARWTGLLLFVATLAAATWHLLTHEPEPSTSDPSWLRRAPIALAIVLPAWGAAVHAVSTLLERERIAERSRHMAKVLRQIAARASRAATFDALRGAVEQAAEVMAMENHEWSVLLSFCRPELSA
jgi:hypothetical protein